MLSDLGLPFRAGIDDIVSIIPLYGDVASSVLQLYQVWLSFVFGVPLQVVGWMVSLSGKYTLTVGLERLA